MCCCSNTYKASCGNTCDGFTIDYAAPADGVYSLVGTHLGWALKIDATIAAGGLLIFDVSNLPLMHFITFQVLLNGVALVFEDTDGNTYDCFELRTRPFGAKFQTVPLTLV